MTSLSFFKYFDSFELDVNVVNFAYYGKTRIEEETEMIEIFTESVLFALVLNFVMSLIYGGILSYSSYQNKIKDIYNLSQTQGE